MGGGIAYDNNDNMIISDQNILLKSYLSISFHGSEQIRGDGDESYMNQNIVEYIPFGEFELNFCSIRCLRNWFNITLDDFIKTFHDRYGYNP